MAPFRSVVLSILLVGATGCGADPATTKDSKPADSTDTPTPTGSAGEAGAAALKTAQDFLKAMAEGKATSASLSTGFKKLIAPPELAADQTAGYSESGVRAWLVAAKPHATADGLNVVHATPDYTVLCTSGNKPGKAYLRMVKSSDRWVVAHARLNARSGLEIPFVGSTPSATLTTIFFVEAALAGNRAELTALLSKAAKGKLATPSVVELFPEGTTFVSLSQEHAGLKAIVTFDSGGNKRAFEIELAPGSDPGEFLIDDLRQK